ncbi:hypothetical protein ACH5RR_004483 [Cinchona calisaya]|uniref:Uncharacterized protein n=1 Tax=Cinchona calisaya TaxID=153742 RepID=A0ABD3AYL6_9GENT
MFLILSLYCSEFRFCASFSLIILERYPPPLDPSIIIHVKYLIFSNFQIKRKQKIDSTHRIRFHKKIESGINLYWTFPIAISSSSVYASRSTTFPVQITMTFNCHINLEQCLHYSGFYPVCEMKIQ